MSRVTPIPTTRISNLFIRQRLTEQVQADQLDLFRLQNQVSTGRRIYLPSDDPPAALRSMILQRLLERRDQLQSNLFSSNTYLAAADASLQNVSTIIRDIRSAALHLEKHKLGCLPVVRKGKIVGIVTETDFVAVAINLLEQLESQELAEPADEIEEALI